MRIGRKSQNGFTLIELMIVVVIIGILASLAIPRFMMASVKSKQSEAKAILKQIYVNQRTYMQQDLTSNYYTPVGVANAANPNEFSEIWIEIQPAARYSYSIVVGGGGKTFTATATANIDDDATMDIWTITDQGALAVTAGNDDVID